MHTFIFSNRSSHKEKPDDRRDLNDSFLGKARFGTWYNQRCEYDQ